MMDASNQEPDLMALLPGEGCKGCFGLGKKTISTQLSSERTNVFYSLGHFAQVKIAPVLSGKIVQTNDDQA